MLERRPGVQVCVVVVKTQQCALGAAVVSSRCARRVDLCVGMGESVGLNCRVITAHTLPCHAINPHRNGDGPTSMQNGVKADSRQPTVNLCTVQEDWHIPSMTASRSRASWRAFNSVRSLLRSFLPCLTPSLATPYESGQTPTHTHARIHTTVNVHTHCRNTHLLLFYMHPYTHSTLNDNQQKASQPHPSLPPLRPAFARDMSANTFPLEAKLPDTTTATWPIAAALEKSRPILPPTSVCCH